MDQDTYPVNSLNTTDNILVEDEVLCAADSDITISLLKEGSKRFFRCVGTMFPVFTQKEVKEIQDELIGLCRKKSRATVQEIYAKEVAFCELCVMAAAGFQYDGQSLPDGDPKKCTQFYQMARCFLDQVVEKDRLRAMRVCSLSGLYSVIAKSTLAVSYTGTFHSCSCPLKCR